MRGSPFALIIVAGLVPLALLGALVVGLDAVKWQPPLLWKTEVRPNGYLAALASDNNGVYASGYSGSALFLNGYDFSGKTMWTRQLSADPRWTEIDHEAVGSDGLYLSGSTNVTVFVEKHDLNGNELWTNQFDNITIGPVRPSMAAGPSAVYLVGKPPLANGPSGPQAWRPVILLRSYGLDGSVQWTKTFLSNSSESLLVSASLNGSVLLSGGDSLESVSNIEPDPFISRLDSNGNIIWTRNFDTSTFKCDCVPLAMANDQSGIYAASETENSGLFLQKLDWNGNVLWSLQSDHGGEQMELAIEATSGALYLLAGLVQRFDASSGHLAWTAARPAQASWTGLAVGRDGWYAGINDDSPSLGGYSSSSSLVIGEVNPPYSFIILATIVGVPAAIILVEWIRVRKSGRNLPLKKNAVTKSGIGNAIPTNLYV